MRPSQIPDEVYTPYTQKGYQFYTQLQKQLIAKYKSTTYSQDVFDAIVNDIKATKTEISDLTVEQGMALQSEPYPDWIKCLYRTVIGLTDDQNSFNNSMRLAGFLLGMTFQQTFETIFGVIVTLTSPTSEQ